MNLQNKIEQRAAGIAIVGQGYVGLPLAVEFAKAGFQVTGIEADPERVAALTRGDSYIPDVPGAELQQVIQNGAICCHFGYGSLNETRRNHHLRSDTAQEIERP